MSRIITHLMVVFITIVAVGLGSANAQHAPGNPWCDAKWMKSGKSATYQDFMDSCLRLVHGEQLSPAAWKQWQQWQQVPVKIQMPRSAPGRIISERMNALPPSNTSMLPKRPKLEDMTIEERANFLFPWMSQGDQRTQYIIDEMRASADRQQGNSYSIHVK